MTRATARRRTKSSSTSISHAAIPAIDDAFRFDAERRVEQTVGKRVPIHTVALAKNVDASVITSRADNALCRAICQTHEGRSRCAACYRESLSAALRQKEPQVFVCHAGLASVALPTKGEARREGVIVGRVFAKSPSAAQRKSLAEKLKNLDGGSDLAQLLDKVPVISKNNLLLATRIVRNLASVLSDVLPQKRVSRKSAKPIATNAASSPRFLRHQRICQRVAEFVENNFAQPLSVGPIAAQVNLTPNYLCSVFHKTMRLTLSEHIARVRVQKAQQLLTQPQWHIKEIASQVGFTDPNHFAVVFKKITGHTPTEWRANADAKILKGQSPPAAS